MQVFPSACDIALLCHQRGNAHLRGQVVFAARYLLIPGNGFGVALLVFLDLAQICAHRVRLTVIQFQGAFQVFFRSGVILEFDGKHAQRQEILRRIRRRGDQGLEFLACARVIFLRGQLARQAGTHLAGIGVAFQEVAVVFDRLIRGRLG